MNTAPVHPGGPKREAPTRPVAPLATSIPDDVLSVVSEAKSLHHDLHTRVRDTLIGREVTVKPAVNGIRNRKGVIHDTILTYDVSVGVDLERLDGRPGQLDRLWFRLSALTFLPTIHSRTT